MVHWLVSFETLMSFYLVVLICVWFIDLYLLLTMYLYKQMTYSTNTNKVDFHKGLETCSRGRGHLHFNKVDVMFVHVPSK